MSEYVNRLNQVYANLKVAREFVCQRNLENAESHFYDFCVKLAGVAIADAIRSVDFGEFRSEIKKGITEIMAGYISQRANSKRPVKAIYFEYDMDNDWDGVFFPCWKYSPIDENDDEWACYWEENFEGPAVPDFPDMGIDDWLFESDESVGKFSYAIVRIYIEFARAYFDVPCPVPVCIGFHDQSEISRVFPDSSFS